MNRRYFLKTAALLTTAFASGLYLGKQHPVSSGNVLMAFLPDGQEWDCRMQDLLRGSEFSECQLVTQRLEMPLHGDLVLVGAGRILDPSESFSRTLLSLRQDLQGQVATRMVRLDTHSVTQQAHAREVLIRTPFSEDRYSLDSPREIALEGHLLGSRLRVDGEGVRMIQAACRHEQCCRMGSIAWAGQSIACAPAGILIELA